MIQNLGTFFDNERNRPCKEIHEVGKEVRMRTVNKLLNIQRVALKYLIKVLRTWWQRLCYCRNRSN